MKNKILVMAFLLAAATGVQAQYSDYYYHRVGDTIEWRSEIGYYAWWRFEFYYANNLNIWCDSRSGPEQMGSTCTPSLHYERDSVVVVQKYYTPTPLRIVGLAGGCERARRWLSEQFEYAFQYRDTDEYKNYFVIYDAMPDSFPLVGMLEWNPFDPYRILHVQNHTMHANRYDSTCCKYSPSNTYVPIYEYYFDNPITVYDSFYVGGTFFGDNFDLDTGIRTGYWAAHSYGVAPPCEAAYYNNYECLIDTGLYKTKYGLNIEPNNPMAYMNRSFSDAPWEWFTQRFCHMLVYPLIEVDTTVPPASACDSVGNIQVTTSGTTATVTWDDFPNYTRVLLRHGKRNEPESQWREEDVTGSTLLTLTGLDPMTFYRVTMKAECEKKDTPWSAPVGFYIASDTSGGGTGGIEGGTLLSQLTFLQPNPAQDEVQVSSSFSLSEIDIWTADGVMVYHGSATGHEATLDVSWLRTGTYIVAIHTHNGTTHKRLLIAR